jgi:transcription antitermination factor NusG
VTHECVGDVVKVVEGDLRNLEGVVESADDDIVTIRPKHKDLEVFIYLFILNTLI